MDDHRDALRRDGRRRSWPFVVGSVAAVLGILLTLQVGRHGSGPDTPTPASADDAADAAGATDATDAADVDVPWAALPPTYPKILRHRVRTGPGPATVKAAPACRASDLDAKAHKEGLTGGTWLVFVEFTLSGPEPCRLQGHHDTQLLDAGRQVDVPTKTAPQVARPVLVRPGRPALLDLTWGNWCEPRVKADELRITLPGHAGTFTVPGFGASPTCMSEADHGASPVGVSPFTARDAAPSRKESAFAHVVVSLHVPDEPVQGRPLQSLVTLTAPEDVVLDPCPDFSILQATRGGNGSEDRYSLNCGAVPYRDDSGRPYLPAHRPVSFAMRTDIVAGTDPIKLIWRLEVPEHPAAGATLP